MFKDFFTLFPVDASRTKIVNITMRVLRAHRLAPKSILDRRKIPVKQPKVPQLPPSTPQLQPQTAFRRRVKVESTLKAMPITSPTTYLTIHEFPSMRPERLHSYPSTFLRSPLRKDILHKAIVYEANAARGTGGHTKTRGEVRGSTRKIRQQKGTGMARVGARVAPGRRGGGIVFGPRRRSFASGLPRKVYALAYRTAISYRYSKSQLFLTAPQFLEIPKTYHLLNLLRQLKWTRKAGGGTLFVTGKERKNLANAAKSLGADVTVKSARNIKVRDLLLMGRVVFEQGAFESLIQKYGVDRPQKVRRDPILEYERLARLL